MRSENLKIRNMTTGNRKKKDSSDVESLDMYNLEEDGFIEGDIDAGRSIASFSFGSNVLLQNNSSSSQETVSTQSKDTAVLNVQTDKPIPKGLTPPIDGEHFSIKRCYQLRPSTLRKLNELKAKHDNINVYLNTIVDAAIRHYHDYVINGNDSTKQA